MEPFRVLAWDPGGSSGWAFYAYNGTVNGNHWFQSGTVTDPEHHNVIRHIIEQYAGPDEDYPLAQPAYVVTESFDFRMAPDSAKQRRGLELISREYIGVMKLVCADLCVPLHQQSAATVLGNVLTSDEKLDRLGQLHRPLHEQRHRNDAMRHLVHYLLTKKRVPEIREGIKRGKQ